MADIASKGLIVFLGLFLVLCLALAWFDVKKRTEQAVKCESAGGIPYKTGGQHVGLTHSGVLIVHQPTGLGVVSVSERSQYRNKERALIMLEILVELEDSE